MALPAGIRALGLAMLVAGAASCAVGAAGPRGSHSTAEASADKGRVRPRVGEERAAHSGFDPARFSRASALARVARALASSAEKLSTDAESLCSGDGAPSEYCSALQTKVRELRAMASQARAACRRVSSGMLTSAGDGSLCADGEEPTRRVLVIQPVVP